MKLLEKIDEHLAEVTDRRSGLLNKAVRELGSMTGDWPRIIKHLQETAKRIDRLTG